MRSPTYALLAALALCAAPFCAAEAPAPADMRSEYDKAFSYYMAGDYPHAIEHWNAVLSLDAKQVTARNMIEEARQKMAGSSAGLKAGFYALVNKGHYSEALVRMETMLASDPTSPVYQKLQATLRRVSAVVARRPAAPSRHWNAAAAGLNAWLKESADLPFAYDALRYAGELAPQETVFPRLVALLEEEDPQLRLNDTKPANAAVLDHKKDLALRYIYDSKFYLAAKELESVLRLEPEDITALKRAGSVYLQLKDYRQARKAWQKAAELSPGDEQLKEYLAALDKVSPPGAEAAPRKGARKKARAPRT
ncbi:MAG: tetratricopeptide repeat protein [Elusimicrobiota bacterium]